MSSVFPSGRRCQRSTLWLGLLSGIWLGLISAVAAGLSVDDPELQIEWGFDGQVRLGFWQPFRVIHPDRLQPTEFELQVLDGDETPIRYRGSLRPAGDVLNLQQGYFKLGRSFGTADLTLFDRDGAVVGRKKQTIPPAMTVPSSRPLVLTISAGDSIRQTIAGTSIGEKEDQKKLVIPLTAPGSQLPLESLGYEGVSTVLISLDQIDWLAAVSQQQWNSLEAWIKDGGKLILAVPAGREDSLNPAGLLRRFFVGEVLGTSALTNTTKLDNFAGAGPLLSGQDGQLLVSHLNVTDGQVLVEQEGIPLIVRRSFGLGEITIVTFNLEAPIVSQWNGYKNLLYQLQHSLSLQEASQYQRAGTQGGAVSHAGYDDLIGQLRVALDRFQRVQFLPFSIIALLIAAYILCVGPGDYFLHKKLTRKMELTWISFPLITLLFGGLALWTAYRVRPTELQINQLEIIDIDSVSGHVRGSVWSNLYSPQGGEFDIELSSNNRLIPEIDQNLIAWHGLPGKGYGGMQTKSSTGFYQVGYLHQRLDSEQPVQGTSRLLKTPIFVASSKPLFTRYQGRFPTSVRSNLRLRGRASRLEGTITNPFDLPLKNCRIFFENYVYVLEQPWEPGETISVETETKERTLVSLLTRRQRAADDATKLESVPWNENETRINRIADMLMFHSAAGGSNYTSGLTHNYHNFADMSSLLGLGRALIVAEVAGPASSLVINGLPGDTNYDQSVTLLRIVLPVNLMDRKR
jgi:hypothetical protein